MKRMVERGVVLASAFPGLYIELQGPADARRRVHPALLRISRAILLPQANMERNLVLQIQDLKFLRPDFGQIFPTSQILTTLTKRAVI